VATFILPPGTLDAAGPGHWVSFYRDKSEEAQRQVGFRQTEFAVSSETIWWQGLPITWWSASPWVRARAWASYEIWNLTQRAAVVSRSEELLVLIRHF
jgi:hypothetical protein